ncbi:hypothetical protein VAB18032_06015 [Micromonospora maris AB-18-032]|nr:hypothetical protein VAB18032_06015 [Micromonospora maris AB-18-032]
MFVLYLHIVVVFGPIVTHEQHYMPPLRHGSHVSSPRKTSAP